MTEVWNEIMADASLGDTTFPVERRGVSGGRDFGRIRPAYQPGQRVEDTGRQPYVFKLSIPLFNGVEGRDDLYPTVFEELLDIFTNDEEKAEIEYTDPILGAFTVKVSEWEVDETAQERDGARITCTLEEITPDGFGFLVPARSPGREAIEAAAQLDEQLDELGVNDTTIDAALAESGFPKNTEEKSWPAGRTFESLASDFQEGLALGIVVADQVAASVDAVRARLRAVSELPTVRTPQGWLAYAAALRLVDALGREGDAAMSRAVAIEAFTVQGVISVYDLAVRLYNDASRADEIMRRNRIASPWAIPAGTVVRVAAR